MNNNPHTAIGGLKYLIDTHISDTKLKERFQVHMEALENYFYPTDDINVGDDDCPKYVSVPPGRDPHDVKEQDWWNRQLEIGDELC